MVTWEETKITEVSLDMPQNGLISRGQKIFHHKYVYIKDKFNDLWYITCTEFLSLDLGSTWTRMETKTTWLHNEDSINPPG